LICRSRRRRRTLHGDVRSIVEISCFYDRNSVRFRTRKQMTTTSFNSDFVSPCFSDKNSAPRLEKFDVYLFFLVRKIEKY
jgi:hypothetical protein